MNARRLKQIAVLQIALGIGLIVLSVLAWVQIQHVPRAVQSLTSAMETYTQSVSETKEKVAEGIPHIKAILKNIADVTATVAVGADKIAGVMHYIPGGGDNDKKLEAWAADAKTQAKYLKDDAPTAVDSWGKVFVAACDQTIIVLGEAKEAVQPSNLIMTCIPIGGTLIGIIVIVSGYSLLLLAVSVVKNRTE